MYDEESRRQAGNRAGGPVSEGGLRERGEIARKAVRARLAVSAVSLVRIGESAPSPPPGIYRCYFNRYLFE